MASFSASSSGPVHADLEHLSHDPNLAMKIMKKRQEEMARRAKLQDPRRRMLGVDHSVLDEQVAEKRFAREKEAMEEAHHAKNGCMVDEILQTIEGAKQDMQRARQKETMEFNRQHLRKEDRREFELSDPTAMKREEPIPDYSKMGPCSMQVFEGHHVPDKSDLAAQTAAWLNKQKQEKCDREEDERQRDLFFDQQQIMSSHIRKYIDQTEEEEAKQEKIAEAQANLALAEQHRARREDKAEKERQAKAAHVEHITNDEMLSEKHDWKLGSHGKLIRTEYRRLTVEEEQDVHNTNMRLLLEKKAKTQFEEEDEAIQVQNIQNCIGVLGALEGERDRIQREKRLELVAHNNALAQAKRARDVEERRAYKSFDRSDRPF